MRKGVWRPEIDEEFAPSEAYPGWVWGQDPPPYVLKTQYKFKTKRS